MLNVEFQRNSFQIYGDKLSSIELERQKSFEKNCWQGLYELSFLPMTKTEEKNKSENSFAESFAFSYLHRFANTFLQELKNTNGLEISREKTSPKLSDEQIQRLVKDAPFALGAEFIDESWIKNAVLRLTEVFAEDMKNFNGTVADYLEGKQSGIKIPERVFFHLVEHKEDNFPFAFMATYATQNSDGSVRHVPLNYALTEYKNDRDKLMSLLSCLNKAAGVSEFVSDIVRSGEMFHPLKLTPKETYDFLRDIGKLEQVGILCRVPNWWRKKNSSVKLAVKIGEKKKSLLGLDSLLEMQPVLMVNGVELTIAEIKKLLSSTDGLAKLKGKWIEVDKERLNALLSKLDEYNGDISVLSALRIEAGLSKSEGDKDISPEFIHGKWLDNLLTSLKSPKDLPPLKVPSTVNAELRHYQKDGFNWLYNMTELGFGACLADDMGLGKTLQVLTFLESLRNKNPKARILLIVPASLLSNWTKETQKFVPKVTMKLLHGRKKDVLEEELKNLDQMVTVTTYNMASRLEALQKIKWDGVILDEAQAIKNPGTKQTKNVKKIPAKLRIALTGTPIENDLSNLWSLFDFLNHGLLGSAKEFDAFVKSLVESDLGYSRLKEMISPFILRRVKTDKNIIADLPDKIEQIDYISPCKKQIILYRKAVADLEEQLLNSENDKGIKRQGLVLGAITKLKQICNHPDQFLGNTVFKPEESGKFELLKEICEVIRSKRERALIFTQYREMVNPLMKFLSSVFGKKGLAIHGATPVKKRPAIVEQFNGEEYVPFMVLSVKAAGTGLNLTAANHVIHFDRWWNPAVENQATDRAFRIGQQNNVTIHKFVTEGTIEERIDEIITGKSELAEGIIGDGAKLLTQMSNEELIKLLKFDVTE